MLFRKSMKAISESVEPCEGLLVHEMICVGYLHRVVELVTQALTKSACNGCVLSNTSVVHPEEAPKLKWMAVGLGHKHPRVGRAHMGKDER